MMLGRVTAHAAKPSLNTHTESLIEQVYRLKRARAIAVSAKMIEAQYDKAIKLLHEQAVRLTENSRKIEELEIKILKLESK